MIEDTKTELPGGGRRITGWKAIAACLQVSVRTSMRWQELYGLPVRRVARGGRPFVYAWEAELESWLNSTAGAEARRETPDEPAGARPAAETWTAVRP